MTCIDFTDVVELAAQLYGDDLEAINDWLDSPQPLLDGKTPQSLIAAGRKDEVIAMLRRALDCTYI